MNRTDTLTTDTDVSALLMVFITVHLNLARLLHIRQLTVQAHHTPCWGTRWFLNLGFCLKALVIGWSCDINTMRRLWLCCVHCPPSDGPDEAKHTLKSALFETRSSGVLGKAQTNDNSGFVFIWEWKITRKLHLFAARPMPSASVCSAITEMPQKSPFPAQRLSKSCKKHCDF